MWGIDMGKIVKINNSDTIQVDDEKSLVEITQGLLMDVRTSIQGKKTLSVPIAELVTLGMGVSSLVPALIQ